MRSSPLLLLLLVATGCEAQGERFYWPAIYDSDRQYEWTMFGDQRELDRRMDELRAAPTSTTSATTLEVPVVAQHQFTQGPGVNLVALNRQRFELEHHHPPAGSIATESSDLRRGALIEASLASIPERIMSHLPDDVNRELIDSVLATDPTLVMGPSGFLGSATSSIDPDDASIERLTKSCLNVHASSASPEQLNVTFHLYTKNNPLTPIVLSPQVTRQELIRRSPFDPRKPIKWITHGFHTNLDKSEWMVETKDKILAFEDANVFLTDWRRGASPALAFYPKAAANAHVVAKMIVKILRRLKSDVDLSRVHLIGHSLGAHIMGFVGSAFTEEYLHQQQQFLSARSERSKFWQDNQLSRSDPVPLIGRISACDPALPCFGPSSSAPNPRANNQHVNPQPSTPTAAYDRPAQRPDTIGLEATDWTPTMWTHLRPDSAILVEVMHSNPGVMGYAEPLGDFDFYPNGFERQPGCGNIQEDAGQNVPEYQRDVMGRMADRYGHSRHAGRRKREARASKSEGVSGFMSSILKSVPLRKGSRLSGTFDRFIKPIKDFVNGYTCSHHRSVEYMVESMYYEMLPRDRKLDKELVCQMVGYWCPDYASFKKGFCFTCRSDIECRAFLTPVGTVLAPTTTGHNPSLVERFDVDKPPSSARMMDKFRRTGKVNTSEAIESSSQNNLTTSEKVDESSKSLKFLKRVMPTFNHYNEKYKATVRNKYFLDTKPTKNYCLNHYHLLVKYRWFRIRESVAVDAFVLSGTLASISQEYSPAIFNKFTQQAYTMLITHPSFLGQIESLEISGDRIKPMQIEYVEVTYMSNLDPRVRSLGSARLCRSSPSRSTSRAAQGRASGTVFVRCTGPMV